MNTLSAGFWGSYFCIVALVLAGAVVAGWHGIHRVARNAAISAAASGLFVVAFLGWLPIEDLAVQQRLLGQIAALTSTLLLYMLLFMLGHLRRQRVRRSARWGLVLMASAVVLAGSLLPAQQALVLGSLVACILGVGAFGVVGYSALRGDRQTLVALGAVFFMLVALCGLCWMAIANWRVHWTWHAVSAVAATGYLVMIALAMWSRYSYLLELRRVVTYGPSYDPVTRMRSHAETGQMVGEVFYRSTPEDETISHGLIVISISNLYALEKLHGRAAVNHALYMCATRIRRCVSGPVETGRLGEDGFLLLVRNLKDPRSLVRLSRQLVSVLTRPVSLSTAADPVRDDPETLRWEAEVGIGLLAAARPRIRAASAVTMARAMSRTAWSFPSRIAWYDQGAGQIAELPQHED